MRRTDVVFSSDGVACAAWLYRPDGEGQQADFRAAIAHARDRDYPEGNARTP